VNALVPHNTVVALDPTVLHEQAQASVRALLAEGESANTIRSYARGSALLDRVVPAAVPKRARPSTPGDGRDAVLSRSRAASRGQGSAGRGDASYLRREASVRRASHPGHAADPHPVPKQLPRQLHLVSPAPLLEGAAGQAPAVPTGNAFTLTSSWGGRLTVSASRTDRRSDRSRP